MGLFKNVSVLSALFILACWEVVSTEAYLDSQTATEYKLDSLRIINETHYAAEFHAIINATQVKVEDLLSHHGTEPEASNKITKENTLFINGDRVTMDSLEEMDFKGNKSQEEKIWLIPNVLNLLVGKFKPTTTTPKPPPPPTYILVPTPTGCPCPPPPEETTTTTAAPPNTTTTTPPPTTTTPAPETTTTKHPKPPKPPTTPPPPSCVPPPPPPTTPPPPPPTTPPPPPPTTPPPCPHTTTPPPPPPTTPPPPPPTTLPPCPHTTTTKKPCKAGDFNCPHNYDAVDNNPNIFPKNPDFVPVDV